MISFTIKEVRDRRSRRRHRGVRILRASSVMPTSRPLKLSAIRQSGARWRSGNQRWRRHRPIRNACSPTVSLAKQAEAQRDLDVKKAQALEISKRQQAQADKASMQTNVMQQQVVAEQVKIRRRKAGAGKGAGHAEIARREKELIATVLKGAEIERQRIQTLAEAEKSRLMAEAEGKASAIKQQGEAEAEIIFKKGDAEARAMNVKAEAYQEYNQAAVVDKLITSLPEVVRALASPLNNVDKITIVSTGNGDSAGISKITRGHREDGGAGAGIVRDAIGHADVGAVWPHPRRRR